MRWPFQFNEKIRGEKWSWNIKKKVFKLQFLNLLLSIFSRLLGWFGWANNLHFFADITIRSSYTYAPVNRRQQQPLRRRAWLPSNVARGPKRVESVLIQSISNLICVYFWKNFSQWKPQVPTKYAKSRTCHLFVAWRIESSLYQPFCQTWWGPWRVDRIGYHVGLVV